MTESEDILKSATEAEYDANGVPLGLSMDPDEFREHQLQRRDEIVQSLIDHRNRTKRWWQRRVR